MKFNRFRKSIKNAVKDVEKEFGVELNHPPLTLY